MAIQHDTEMVAQITAGFTGTLNALQTSPLAPGAGYSNLYGVTKGVLANNQYLFLTGRYQSVLTDFSNKLNEVSQAFEALDQNEAANFTGGN